MSLRPMFRLAMLSSMLAFAPLAATPAFASPTVDQPAPAFTATTADGKSLGLDSLKGKTVVLEWTNHDCPFVKKHYESGNMQSLHKDAAAKGIVWLQVISSAPGKQGHVDAATALKLNSARSATPAHVILDPEGKLGKRYGAQTTPHIYIIDATGTLVYKGGIDSLATADKADIAKAEPYVANALSSLAAGKKIAANNTKPYGCSVKYE
jgi:peroxiredoxin